MSIDSGMPEFKFPPTPLDTGRSNKKDSLSKAKTKTPETDRKSKEVASKRFSPTSDEVNLAVFGSVHTPSIPETHQVSHKSSHQTTIEKCHENVKQLIQNINEKNVENDKDDLRTQNHARFENLKNALENLSSVTDPKVHTRKTGMESILIAKINRLNRFVEEHFSMENEKELGDFFDFLELDLVKFADEFNHVPKEGSLLDIIPDREARDVWESAFEGRYVVPFDKFYDKIILKIFPEMKENKQFNDFINYMISPLLDEDISAYSWKQFMDLLGPMEKVRENTMTLKNLIGFVGNMSRQTAENLLREYHSLAPSEGAKSIVRFSRSLPGQLIITNSKITPDKRITFEHRITNESIAVPASYPLSGQVARIISMQSEQRSVRINPLPVHIDLDKTLEELEDDDLQYKSTTIKLNRGAIHLTGKIENKESAESAERPPEPIVSSAASSSQASSSSMPQEPPVQKSPVDLMIEYLEELHQEVTQARTRTLTSEEFEDLEEFVKVLEPHIKPRDSKDPNFEKFEKVRLMYRDLRDTELTEGYNIPIPKPKID